MLGELIAPKLSPYAKRPPHFAYVGSITATRGTRQMVEAIGAAKTTETRLKLAGVFQSEAHHLECEALPGWFKTDFQGWVDRQQIASIFSSVRAGLVVLQPTKNYPDSLPVKLFEYMGAGLPVIASGFPLWREIVNGAGCGLLVDPEDPEAIAGAMDWILGNPAEAEDMGRRGQQAVEKTYSWTTESEKLVAFYHNRLDVPLKREL